MALDPRYIVTQDLESYFVDKTTGEPLSGGTVYFWEDAARTTPKLVYELADQPPYLLANSYQPLPNPITLSMTGNMMDAAGNNIVVYYFPYDAAENVQLYYIQVFDQFGVEQFTREAWPNEAIENITPNAGATLPYTNQLTNPQFAQVLFSNNPWVITFGGPATTVVQVAPGWNLNIVSTGAGTVTLTQNSITGITAYPSNPPYTLTITPGANISGLTLKQRLLKNPDIWSPQNAASTNGYIASSILLSPNSSITMQYAPSNGPAQNILVANNLLGVYTEFRNTVQLAPATSVDNSTVGYVDINIVLNTVMPTTLSNIQVVGLSSNIQGILYEQTPVNRQIDQMFNYYNNLLQYKPINSFLVGWDFVLNPHQIAGATGSAGPFATGANTSNYVWDQTILFQSVNNSCNVIESDGEALRVNITTTTGFALIQYLTRNQIVRLMDGDLSVMISAVAGTPPGLPMNGTVSLWTSTDANLPNIGANASIVATLDANGKPATFNGNWVEIPRTLYGNGAFTVQTTNYTNTGQFYNHVGLSGWNVRSEATISNANFFAIVVGFAPITAPSLLDIGSISLVPGLIPTVPAPLTQDEVLRQCQYYYCQSFPQGTVAATGTGQNTGEQSTTADLAGVVINEFAFINYPVTMNRTAVTITSYNPVSANAQVRNFSMNVDCTNTVLHYSNQRGFTLRYTGTAGTAEADACGVHWTADARLGF